MQAFSERFREESWFKKPLDRTWPEIEKKVSRFVKEGLKKLGGAVSKDTSTRDFNRFKVAYESLFFTIVNDLLKRDVGVKNGLYAAMGAGASQLGAGHVYWMKDMTGDIAEHQAEFDGLSQREQGCVVHLQTLTRDLMHHFLEKVVSAPMRSKLVEMLRTKTALDEEVQWSDCVELFRKHLVDVDPRFLAESVLTVRRDEVSALIVWVNFFVTMITYCVDASITFPQHLYYTMFIGQVSSAEMNHVLFEYPKTQAERDAFDFDGYRTAIKGMPQHNFPPFHQRDVRKFTQNMLVAPGSVRDSRTQKGDETKHVKLQDDQKGDRKDRFCKDCNKRHAKGAHTASGTKKRKERMEKAERSNSERNSTRQAKSHARNSDSSRGKPKCFQCGKEHFPFCERKKGDLPKCFECGKNHAPPFCERGSVTKKENFQAESKREDAKKTLKAKISQAVEASMGDLFMMTPVKEGKGSDICRANVELFVSPKGKQMVTACMDTGSSVSVAKAILIHDLRDCDPLPVGGFAGVGSLKRSGYVIAPHQSKPGSTLLKVYADPSGGSLPSGVDILISKRHGAMLGADISRLSQNGSEPEPIQYESREIKDWSRTHFVLGNDGVQHDARLVEGVALKGAFKTGFKVVQYTNGAIVAVKAERVHLIGRALGEAAGATKKCPEKGPAKRLSAPTISSIILTRGGDIFVESKDGKDTIPSTKINKGESAMSAARRAAKEAGHELRLVDLEKAKRHEDDELTGCMVAVFSVILATRGGIAAKTTNATKGLGMKGKWINLRSFAKSKDWIGKNQLSAMNGSMKGREYTNILTLERTSVCTAGIERTVSVDHDVQLTAWQSILRMKQGEYPGVESYPTDGEPADILSVFDGPSGELNKKCEDLGLVAMPPVDVLADEPYSVLNDVHFAAMMVAILIRMPLMVLFAPVCKWYSRAFDFNSGKPHAERARNEGRAEQEKIMERVGAMIRAVFSYGGHVMVENPLSSAFWKQDFIGSIRSKTPSTRIWRDVVVNLCRVGGKHLKAMKFWTTAPAEATDHMALRCDHAHKHPPCTGRDEDGIPRTRSTSAYTPTLIMMLAAVAAVITGAMVGATVDSADAVTARDDTRIDEDIYWSQIMSERDSWFSEFTVDDGFIVPETCAEWAALEWLPTDEHECFLVRDKLQTYWDRTRNAKASKLKGHEWVVIAKDVPTLIAKRVKTAVVKHKRVFNEGLGGLPLAVKGGVVTAHLKDDAKPQRCPAPKWGHGPKRRILERWADEKLATGEFVLAPHCEWGSRLHIALKVKRGSAKADEDFDIRVCGDYVKVNTQCKRLLANQPTIPYQLERGSGRMRYWSTDGRKQYNGWVLTEKASKMLAVWTPRGLLRPTRLQFGWLNAGIICQGDVNVMREKELSQHAIEHSLQAADDFSGFSEDYDIDGQKVPNWDKLADDFIEMLELADRNNMSLKASKTVFGATECMFFGHILDKDGKRAAEHNLCPISKMVAPENKSELRRVLGLCIQHKDAVPGYKMIARPLFKLTGNVPWEWTEVHNNAFETLRERLLKNNILAAPDFKKRFYCAVDASEDGWGYVIYQLKDTAEPDVRANRAVLRYASDAWPNPLRHRPPYYQEGYAFVEAAAATKYYAAASPWPISMKTDHKPLKWLKTCAKGPLNMWRVSRIGDLDYEIEHRKGIDNDDADSVSRHPMLGLRSLVRVGADIALEELLKSFTSQEKDIAKWWVWAGRDTSVMARSVQEYKSSRDKVRVRAPKESFADPAWGLAILMPRTENATAVARNVIDDGRAACVLMPTELVYYTAQEKDRSFNTKYVDAIKSATKITLMANDSTWVCFGTSITRNDVRVGETLTKPPGPTKGWTLAVGTLQEWIKEQKASLASEASAITGTTRYDDGGLAWNEGTDGMSRIYVPKERRVALIELHHTSIHHLAAAKTYNSLQRYFYWPGARSDVRKQYKQCAYCEVSKATRNLTNGMSRAVPSEPPRTRYGMDYYGVGDNQVLGIIDLDSLNVNVAWHERRCAELCKETIRDDILFRHGRFEELRSDHAREFVGRALTMLKNDVGYFHTTTGGYNSKGNATVERFWRYFGNALGVLTDAQYENAKAYIKSIAFAWNVTMSESLGVSPFEVTTGTKAKTVADGFLCTGPSAGKVNVDSIRAAAAEFTRVARANADFNREYTASVLNKHGRVLKSLKVGDYVKIYLPPGHHTAIKRNRKQKHMPQWRGPMEITEKLSPTRFLLRFKYDHKQTYERNIVNIRKWVGSFPVNPPSVMHEAENVVTDIDVGDIVLARDQASSTRVDLACVKALTDSKMTLEVFGTRSKVAKKAKFYPVFTHGTDVYLGKYPRHIKAKRWTWQIKTEDIRDLVPAHGLELQKNNKLSTASLAKLKNIRPRAVLRSF